MTEYLLQKKTIGGWSNVSWWSDYELANKNYQACSKGNSGYSWRLVEVKVVHECMLSKVVDVPAPIINPEPVQDAPRGAWQHAGSTWGSKRTSGDPGANAAPSWGGLASPETHGMVGKVWMINHSTKTRARVSPDEVNLMIEAGYEKGGPKTQFKS